MMNKYPKWLGTLLCLAICIPMFAQEMSLSHISTYNSGIFGESAAEIAAYDAAGKRIFFIKATAAAVDVLDVSDPANPTLVNSIDLSMYGGGANSVDVYNGIVAVAVENNDKQANGRVVFLDTDGNYLNDLEVGALPDMLTFTHDGKKVVVANEGEPNAEYTVDPEGSVTIVDLAAGVANATATQVNFQAWNSRRATLLNNGVRIFGNDGQQTVAQDFEPEYIAVSPDDSRAYVTLQENNALAVVDLNTGTVLDILPLGYKDHSKGTPELKAYNLNETMSWWNAFDLGAPKYGGEVVHLGGFSGLCYDPLTSTNDQLSFWTVPDRGPNEDAIAAADAGAAQDLRPYKLPDYQARLEKLIYIKSQDQFYKDANPIYLKQQDGTPISGKGNVPGFDEIPVTRTDNSVYTSTDFTVNGVNYHQLDFDPFGGDFEGVIRTPDFHFWLCDENRPSIYHFDENGTLVARYVPQGSSMLGDTPQPVGTYGTETLPAVYNLRRGNRGFEAIAYDYDEKIVYAFIQSPIENPGSAQVRNKSDVIRIIGINPANGQPVKEFVYLLERNKVQGLTTSRVDKIGDAVYAGNGSFYILERDSSDPLNGGSEGKKYVYEIKLEGATNILGTAISNKMTSADANDKTLEMMSADDLAANGIVPVYKTKVLNLPSIGYLTSDKSEGLALLPDGGFAVINDNDFGLAGAGITDNTTLGMISFGNNYGFDASDKLVEEIAITNHPVLGMYLPDAIASFQANGKPYFITANEGDSRDYDGYSEEARVKDLVLDPAFFPNATDLQKDKALGRLKTTTSMGDIDQDGMNEIIYSYGARSFSVWDAYGNLVFDSGDDFEQLIAQVAPDYFNSTNDSNDSFKSRSDDKGPEPEGVTIGQYNGNTYAFIGLERQGGVMVYNINDPKNPYFVDYVNHRDFTADAETVEAGDLGVEGLLFINATDSPNGQPMLVTANEVSGTVSLFGVSDGGLRQVVDRNSAAPQTVATNNAGVFPNPFNNQFSLHYHTATEGHVQINLLNTLGQTRSNLYTGTKEAGDHLLRVNLNDSFAAGMYWIVISQDGKTLETISIVKK